jgi:HAD superfamily hydrolase (TIGR01490 family)
MTIAFFDLDKTLLARNSGQLWIRSELRQGFITRWQALRAMAWLTRYHLGFARLEDAILESIRSLAGGDEAELKARTLRFYHSEVRGLVRPGARDALARHRAAGESLVLLTSSTDYLSEAVATDLSLDGVLCNRFEIDERGCYTGRPLGGLCYGPGKLSLAREYAGARGVELSQCAFYTDSASDLPVLEAVGRPVAVNPDPRLRREARRRGWPVVDWGDPGVTAAGRR